MRDVNISSQPRLLDSLMALLRAHRALLYTARASSLSIAFPSLGMRERTRRAWTDERLNSASSSVHQYDVRRGEREMTRGIASSHTRWTLSRSHTASSSTLLSVSPCGRPHEVARSEASSFSWSSFVRAHLLSPPPPRWADGSVTGARDLGSRCIGDPLCSGDPTGFPPASHRPRASFSPSVRRSERLS